MPRLILTFLYLPIISTSFSRQLQMKCLQELSATTLVIIRNYFNQNIYNQRGMFSYREECHSHSQHYALIHHVYYAFRQEPVQTDPFVMGAQGVATFSLARGAISSPSIPGSLPATSRLNSMFSHFFAGPCSS